MPRQPGPCTRWVWRQHRLCLAAHAFSGLLTSNGHICCSSDPPVATTTLPGAIGQRLAPLPMHVDALAFAGTPHLRLPSPLPKPPTPFPHLQCPLDVSTLPPPAFHCCQHALAGVGGLQLLHQVGVRVVGHIPPVLVESHAPGVLRQLDQQSAEVVEGIALSARTGGGNTRWGGVAG